MEEITKETLEQSVASLAGALMAIKNDPSAAVRISEMAINMNSDILAYVDDKARSLSDD